MRYLFFRTDVNYICNSLRSFKPPNVMIKSDGQEISTIEWQELKNEIRLFSDQKKLLRIEEI